jgi:hypothetical protein
MVSNFNIPFLSLPETPGNKPLRYLPKVGSLKAGIVFGNLRDKCGGQGICMIEPDGTKATYNCLKTPVLFIKQSKNSFMLLIAKTLLPASVAQKQFPSSYFIMEDDYPLPAFFVKEFQLETALVIPRGTYEIMQTNLFIQVTLPFLHQKKCKDADYWTF